MSVTAVVLAGGLSTRMREDKAEIIWRGRTLLESAVRACVESGLDVLVVGRPKPQAWPMEGVEFVCDVQPGLGPLGALITAFEHVKEANTAILVIACDMPLLDRTALSWLTEEFRTLQDSGHGLVAVSPDGTIQPLFAVYTASALPHLRRRLDYGRRSLTGAIESGRFRRVEVPEYIDRKLTNVNTPDEFALLTHSHAFENPGGNPAPDAESIRKRSEP